MPAITKARETHAHAMPMILKGWVNYEQSRQKGMLLTLEELPKFLSKGGMGRLESTEEYYRGGLVWFYLATKGTDMRGAYRFNPDAETLEDMFRKVSRRELGTLLFSEIALFYPGDHQLSVSLHSSPGSNFARLIINGNSYDTAPVAVVKQQAQPGSQAAVHRSSAELVANARDAAIKLDDLVSPNALQPIKDLLRTLE